MATDDDAVDALAAYGNVNLLLATAGVASAVRVAALLEVAASILRELPLTDQVPVLKAWQITTHAEISRVAEAMMRKRP